MLFLENVNIKICLTSPDAKTPLKSYADSAGFDLYACQTVLVLPKNQSWVNIGVCMQIPLGYCGIIYSRSGLATKGITVFNGVIDPGFSGEVKVLVFNCSCKDYFIEKGTRFAQIVFYKTAKVFFNFDLFNFDSDRNNKGFGSSGVC